VRDAADKNTWIYASVACALGLVAAFAVLETALRLLAVREPFQAQPVTRDNPYLHFKPSREVVFSMGWDFAIVNKVRINNYGFVNAQDYDPEAATPLMAVSGDSYVEAAHVPYAATLYGRLAAAVGPRGRVYSFASPAPRSASSVAHWNGSGHEEAAKAVAETGVLERVFGSAAPHGRIEAGKALR
jgi:hypothetical protein